MRRPQNRPVQKRIQKPRKKRIRRDYTLLLLEFFARVGRGIKMGYRRARKIRHFRTISAFVAIILVVLSAAIAIYAAMRPNALEVYIDDVKIGVVRLDSSREITLDYIIRHAAARLESQLGSHVQFSGQIEANAVRLSVGTPSLTFDNLISGLVDALDYSVYGAVIVVNGVEIAPLSSIFIAESTLNDFGHSFRVNIAAGFIYEFLEEVSIVRRYVYNVELMTISEAMNALATPQTTPEVYIVQRGDTFSHIALNMGMTMAALSARNPTVNPDWLEIGQALYVLRTAPVLNVRTVETTENEVITRVNGVVR